MNQLPALLVLYEYFLIINKRMKRNQKPLFDYRKYKNTNPPLEEYETRPKAAEAGLKSLECSSVDQVQPTNQSYQNSWLEKLVSNIDDDKPNPLYVDQNARNFARKSTYNVQYNYAQNSTDPYPRQRSSYSYNKKQLDYTPFSKISEIQNEEYPVSRFRNADYQRIPRNYVNSAEKYKLQRNLPNPLEDKVSIDLNQSSQSYGRIKKLNNNKNKIEPQSTLQANLQKIDVSLSRPSLTAQRSGEREKFLNDAQAKLNAYGSTNTPTYLRESRDYHYSKIDQINLLKRKGSQYFASRESSPKRLEYKQRNAESIGQKYQVAKEQKSSTLSSSQKHYEKQDEFKMDEMAKKLNMVLENINKKSKILMQNGSFEEKKTNKQEPEGFQQKKAEPSPPQSKYKNYASTKAQQLPERQCKQKDRYISSSQLENKYETKYQPKCEPKYEHKYETKYQPRYQSKYESKYEGKQEPKTQLRYEAKCENKAEISLKPKKSEEEHNKYQLMKKSLGMSKHIPPEIILEESSSQINSQVSPRTQFLNREFKLIFDKLDRSMIGELTKTNCALELINDEIKYLFGGIFSKIKYKNQRINFKSFIEECQNVVKQFQFEELKEVLGKTKNITHFKLHEKDTQSERWNNDTNNESQSKRSSERSEVVKKYEFIEQNNVNAQKNQPPYRQKVHWAAPQYSNQNLVQFDKPQLKSSYISNPKDGCLETKDNNKVMLLNTKQPIKPSIPERKTDTTPGNVKENIKQGESQKDKKDFERLCENLNNKLNNYLTTITKKSTGQHHIPLQFSELSKHWNKS